MANRRVTCEAGAARLLMYAETLQISARAHPSCPTSAPSQAAAFSFRGSADIQLISAQVLVRQAFVHLRHPLTRLYEELVVL